jgi:hypothetical protein
MIHGRYTGWGPKPMVAVDIFRVIEGKLAEHWDVLQEEFPLPPLPVVIRCSRALDVRTRRQRSMHASSGLSAQRPRPGHREFQ